MAFTKKAVDIEALMAQAAALELEAANAKTDTKKTKEKKPKKEKAVKKREDKPSTPKREKPKKEKSSSKSSSKTEKKSSSKSDKKKKSSKSKKHQTTERKKTFGVPLSELELEDDEDMPVIFMDLISVLEVHATEIEGLFRKTASIAAVDNLIERFEQGEDIDWGDIEDHHLIGGVLMALLLRLPEPLITFQAYDELVSVVSSGMERDEQLKKMKTTISALPQLNYTMLEHLLDFLDTMTRDSDDNLMTADNLAICFGPGLMRRKEENLAQLMKEAGMVTTVVSLLIEQYGFFFRDEGIEKEGQKSSKAASTVDFDAFITVAQTGFTVCQKMLSGIVTDLEWEKMWSEKALSHLFIANDLLVKIADDEISKITAGDITNEIEESLSSYEDNIKSRPLGEVCKELQSLFQKRATLIDDTVMILQQQSKEKDIVLQAVRLSSNTKLLLETIQPHIAREVKVSSSDISEVKTIVPEVMKKLAQMKMKLDTCTDYSYAVVLSRAIRGIQKALKERTKTPVTDVDLDLGPAVAPTPKDKMKIQNLQDALEFSFPACTKVLKEILAATEDPNKKTEAFRDADLVVEVNQLLDRFFKIQPSAGGPAPIAPHPSTVKAAAGGAPPPVAPHPSAAKIPPPVAPHPSAGKAPPPIAAHPRAKAAPPPMAPHPSASAAIPPPIAAHPSAGRSSKAPPPVAAHPKAAPPPMAPHPSTSASRTTSNGSTRAPPPMAPHPSSRPSASSRPS